MLPVIVFTVCISFASSKFYANDWIHTDSDRVLDYRHNPILVPTDLLEWLLGDPTVVLFEQEDELHMFVNEVFHGIIHYSANYSDPVNFEKHGPIIPDAGSVRPYAYRQGHTLYLYYEQYHAHDLFRESSILMRTADILHTDTGVEFRWTNTSTEMLRPELDWERLGTKRVGNPFVFYSEDHEEYRLYYSASSVHLPDSNIDEPIHLGLARADSPDGPWTRLVEEPLQVDPGDIGEKTLLGFGSLKLIKTSAPSNSGNLFALNNRVMMDADNRTMSTIALLQSSDGGLSWATLEADLIPPQLDSALSWKHAYVYGFDTVPDPDNSSHVLVYYNARSGWAVGLESIGVSKLVYL